LNNCKLNKVIDRHGVNFLKERQVEIIVDRSNKNDVVKILGPASIIDSFDDNQWIYLEQKSSVSDLKSLGKKQLIKNDVLLLKFNNRGILVKKDFYNKNDINDIQFTETETQISNKKAIIENIITTLRKKINDPLGKRTAK